MKLSIATFILGLFLFTSCSKDDDKTTIEILNDHTWKLTAATVSPGVTNPANGSIITDLLAIVGTCLSDNIYSFTKDGKYIEDEGPTKCDASDPQSTAGTLNLSTDNKTFTVDGTVYTFESVADNKIVFTFSATVNTTNQTVKFTMVPR